ncbi:Na+/H+ antiporter subunit G [Pseudomonas citronellolis]|uniref:Na+/H+ antiporter subunit G n=1 Tax=Pseudomonas citronellolis TaxID=53408 RepID=UPI0023E3DCE7|nr:Na+/H+ antiporter subunit G [Pseudomonas citronellolis]MDF3931781.1 Na+/H+ antiporter subunit G [Pseudomonas citronellolis]
MNLFVEILVSALLLGGSLFALLGAVGLYRLPDFYTRLHAPTKASTLGVGGVALGALLYFSVGEGGVSLHEVLITLFLFITAPVSAHLLAKAAMRQRLPRAPGTGGKPWA